MDRLNLTVEIVSSFVEKNRIAVDELPSLIATVHRSLRDVDQPQTDGEGGDAVKKATTAQIRRSIRPDALVSFEDGRPYKMLKRHLRTLGLTPEAYRAKWGLPSDYPMTAADYAKIRSDTAKASGLGRRTGSGRKDPAKTRRQS